MSLAEIKKEFVNRIATLHQQWRATNDITFSREAQQLQFALKLIELEEQKILKRIETLEKEQEDLEVFENPAQDEQRLNEMSRLEAAILELRGVIGK